ncbi:MAG: glycosyltransferase, partial [Bacteroidota bacterium]
MPNIAVVILNYNGENYLKQFLPSVLQYSDQAKVYVADNASTDGSNKVLKEAFSEVTLIEFNKNHGFAGGYNEALKEIDADYYVLLNSDVEVTP